MLQFPVSPHAFEAISDDLGPDRSPLAPLRTLAHAACARRHARQAPCARQAECRLAVVLGGEVVCATTTAARLRG